jgi:hypothetical protein
MSDQARPAEPPPTDDDPTDEDEAARRRRLAEVFGDVLPDTTADERDAGSQTRGEESARDAWYRDQVPPHHG